MADLAKHEAEHGPVTVTSALAAAPPPAGTSYVPTTGDGAQAPAAPASTIPTAVPDNGGGTIPQSTGGIPTGTYASDGDES